MHPCKKEPQQIVLGTTQKMRGTGIGRKYVHLRHTMVYIPILKTLQTLLQSEMR